MIVFEVCESSDRERDRQTERKRVYSRYLKHRKQWPHQKDEICDISCLEREWHKESSFYSLNLGSTSGSA